MRFTRSLLDDDTFHLGNVSSLTHEIFITILCRKFVFFIQNMTLRSERLKIKGQNSIHNLMYFLK